MTKVEEAWLGWARNVLVTNGKPNRCSVCRRDGDTAFDRVLWPGYVGANYRPGGILFVGAVHNLEELGTYPMMALAEIAEKWSLGGADSEAYLSLIKHSYVSSATRRGSAHDDKALLEIAPAAHLLSATMPITTAKRAWIMGTVWKSFERIRREAGVEWSDVAFTNWSKCACISGSTANAKHLMPDQPLLERLPIRELQPGAIFIASSQKQVVQAVQSANLSVPIVRTYHQRWRVSYPDGASWDDWLAEDVKGFRLH